MQPEEDARAILRLALRHEQSLAASLEPGPGWRRSFWSCRNLP
jgi:hypothetical protein